MTSLSKSCVLVVGGGGREHCLSWKLAQSTKVGRVLITPGNGGCSGKLVATACNISAGDKFTALIDLCRRERVDLVVIGPEQPLADGIVDVLTAHGVPCFGPSAAAAELEASKLYSKEFMCRHNIPTAQYAGFTDHDAAVEYVRVQQHRVVIKASGLAAGKGVLLPDTVDEAVAGLHDIMVGRVFGDAGAEVVVEEMLEGEEASVLAFTDGFTVQLMPVAQDHKRALVGDAGLNTGGMGAYAPSPAVNAAQLERIRVDIMQRAVDGLRKDGRPFVGVLYAGLMLTARGIRVLEFNCRLGDPETQVLLPLLRTDLYDVMMACVRRCLDSVTVEFADAVAATVVLASEGYPRAYPKGRVITGLDHHTDGNDTATGVGGSDGSGGGGGGGGVALVFHSGTKLSTDDVVTTNGGRVLAVTGVGSTLQGALDVAYARVESISFDGMHYRTDIGHRGVKRLANTTTTATATTTTTVAAKSEEKKSLYALSGVDIEAGTRAVELMKTAVRKSFTPAVLSDLGSFGGLFSVADLQKLEHPVLVASADGVGTKIKVAAHLRRYGTIGSCLVNHCVNDILVQGARPLFFLDYVAASKIVPEMVAEVVKGCADACTANGCALLGGETAEMPGVYLPDEFDLAGTIVGYVDKKDLIDGSTCAHGDVLIGLESTGLHTNGFSLARRVFHDWDLEAPVAELDGASLGDALLAVHRSYLREYDALVAAGVTVKGMAHITGGGFKDNIPRVLPAGVSACIRRGSWQMPSLFRLIQRTGNVSDAEMAHVFNCGVGLVVVVAAEQADSAMAVLGGMCSYAVSRIGTLVATDPHHHTGERVVYEGTRTFDRPLRIGVLGSTRGTDLQAVLDAIGRGECHARVEVVVSNKADAYILERARAHNVAAVHVSAKGLSREAYDERVSEVLVQHECDLVLLVGYMRILSPRFCATWENRVMNVHPSLLPEFAGGMDLAVHTAVLEAGKKESGCTVHLVTDVVDGGPIVVQKRCEVRDDDTPETLKARVQALEGTAFLEAIAWYASGAQLPTV